MSDAGEAMDEVSRFDAFIANVGSSSPIARSGDELIDDERTEPLLDARRPRMLAKPLRRNSMYTDELVLGRYAYCELLGRPASCRTRKLRSPPTSPRSDDTRPLAFGPLRLTLRRIPPGTPRR